MIIDHSEFKRLMADAQKIKPRPAGPNPREVALELFEIVGLLWQKGFTRKRVHAWFAARGYKFKFYHLYLALKKWHEVHHTYENHG